MKILKNPCPAYIKVESIRNNTDGSFLSQFQTTFPAQINYIRFLMYASELYPSLYATSMLAYHQLIGIEVWHLKSNLATVHWVILLP